MGEGNDKEYNYIMHLIDIAKIFANVSRNLWILGQGHDIIKLLSDIYFFLCHAQVLLFPKLSK